MRVFLALGAFLTACSGIGPGEEPSDPEDLAVLLGSDDPRKREEAAHRLSLKGQTVHEALETRERAEAIIAVLDEDTASMRARLTRALATRDAQQIVCRAYHILRGGCLGREWRRVSKALGDQRFQLIEIYEPHERTKFVRFLAKASAYVNGAGDRHDLFFWVKTVRMGDGVPRRWGIREVYVGLHVAFEAAFRSVAARRRYPPGSVLAQFLELPEIQKLAIVFPVLEEIELTYGRIRDKELETVPAGYHVNASFLGAGREKGGGRGVFYTAESGLDPPSTPEGRLLWEAFAPSGTLGPLTFRGSSFWGAGGLRPQDD